MARERIRFVDVRVGTLPKWYRPEVHGQRFEELLRLVVQARHGRDVPSVQIVYAGIGPGEAIHLNAHRVEVGRDRIDITPLLLTVLVETSPPWGSVAIGGSLQLATVEFLATELEGVLVEVGHARAEEEALTREQRESLMQVEEAVREIMALLVGVPPVKPFGRK